jgi:nicotinamidase-related amidase
MLMERTKSCLLLIDVQEKLTPHIHNPEALINNCLWLLQLAHDLQVPCLVSEQYPKGLGPTVKALMTPEKAFEKVTFSSCRAPDFPEAIQQSGKTQILLMGIETHVCVLQTAMDLQKSGFSVFIATDAVSSRTRNNYKYALKRMAQAGIHLVTCEMVFFEWLGQAGTEEFKLMSKKYLQECLLMGDGS